MNNTQNSHGIPPLSFEEKLSIVLLFSDRDGLAIQNLRIKLTTEANAQSLTSNSSGKVLAENIPNNKGVEIEVQRPDGSFKPIGSFNSGTKPREISIFSPSRKIETITKITQGLPGAITKDRLAPTDSRTVEGRTSNGSPVVAISRARAEKSGEKWVGRYLSSRDIKKLKSPFKENLTAFITALNAAGVTVTINTTLRPPQRSYLMYYAREIATGRIQPDKVPEFTPRHGDEPVMIDWAHRHANGKADIATALKAAKEMDSAYGAAGVIGKPYRSNHNGGKAVDMKFIPAWAIGKTITTKSGITKTITSRRAIIEEGAKYNVFHWSYSGPRAKDDDPHWSETGN